MRAAVVPIDILEGFAEPGRIPIHILEGFAEPHLNSESSNLFI
jgi:hypothetical protein